MLRSPGALSGSAVGRRGVFVAAGETSAGVAVGGNHQGTLETGEVDLAPFHELETIIPDHIKADLEQLKADIIASKIQTKPED